MRSMHIVTWNCRRGPLEQKIEAVARFQADVVVLTEAPRPKIAIPGSVWFGAGRLGVLVLPGSEQRTTALSDGSGCVHAVRVRGTTEFDLLAVWTWPQPSYLGAFEAGLKQNFPLIRPDRLVIAGDFNGGPQFDRPRSRRRWDAVFAELHDRGLHSAYHALRNESFGAESDATHWHQGNPGKPHHIDYVFAPERWIGPSASIDVGAFHEWHKLSDHAPIALTIPLTANQHPR
jgi:endonuclease/exonuclease/phosphatase family metal-dependent hydrolase